ncbi:MAG TPA: SRPBCC family protein [Terriglobia bacterium]|nr:SRPBCC family protein [Terriglobia bacterium]
MKFQNSCVLRAPSQKLWAFLTDIPSVARCLPGVEEVSATEQNQYAGVISVKVGVVKLRLAGRITIERMDAESRVASMRVEAADQKVNGMVRGLLTMNLEPLAAEETRLNVETDVNLFGKIGEFGQPMIKKKADQMMTEFAGNVAGMVGAAPAQDRPRTGSILGLSN